MQYKRRFCGYDHIHWLFVIYRLKSLFVFTHVVKQGWSWNLSCLCLKSWKYYNFKNLFILNIVFLCMIKSINLGGKLKEKNKMSPHPHQFISFSLILISVTSISSFFRTFHLPFISHAHFNSLFLCSSG